MNSMFGLNGILGMLIATALLLSILTGLSIWAVNVQAASAVHPYAIKSLSGKGVANPKTIEDVYQNLKEIKMRDVNSLKVQISNS